MLRVLQAFALVLEETLRNRILVIRAMNIFHRFVSIAQSAMPCVGLLLVSAAALGQKSDTQSSINAILNQVQALEGESDPKCYATASRLEDFMFGTPLSASARNRKNELQKDLVTLVWRQASKSARSEERTEVNAKDIEGAATSLFSVSRSAKGHWSLRFPNGQAIRIHGTDKRQYSSIAYSLRAILAVQQEALLDPEDLLLPLTQPAVEVLKNTSDFYTLAVLKVADAKARADSDFELSESRLAEVWNAMLPARRPPAPAPDGAARLPAVADLSLAYEIINRKVAAYAKYNNISNQLFVRNLQVYFAKRRWPATSEEATAFRRLYTEALIAMAREIYLGAEQTARARKSTLVQERDVGEFIRSYMPHRVNPYEDAVFFPRLPKEQQVFIEAYDMDAFRDSGVHWRYLQFALQSDGFQAGLAPDPFALELLTESIAQLGVLLLRLTGEVTESENQKRLATTHLEKGIRLYRDRVAANSRAPAQSTKRQTLKSAAGNTKQDARLLFQEVTEDLQIHYMHRSSDWLNRQLRSYLRKDENTGIITIPPAFGGAGVAVGDINDDGRDDILLLGGLGNRLYVSRGPGSFVDITRSAGLEWVRAEDKRPGEPRQPLLADLDNDGDQDIVITYVNDPHRVYRNNGDETFSDVTANAGLAGAGLVGGPATVFDYDGDGPLDLYITYFGN